MALQREISNALSFATSKGYQVHPDAFAMLKGLDTDILKLIQEIIKIKIKYKENSLILVEDIRNLISIDEKVSNIHVQQSSDGSFYNDSNSMIMAAVDFSSSNQSLSYKVISDPTPYINTGEGVKGYTSLFRSRFDKSLRILAQRPSSKRITKISSIKHTRGSSAHMEKLRNYTSTTNSSIIAGLLMSKRSTKNGIEMLIDDDSGMLNAFAITEEVKKQTSMLTLDQMVMLELDNSKRTQSFVIKNITSPDIPEHLPNRSKSGSYAVLISDLHVGSKYFMETEFIRFLKWLSSTNDEVVRKIKFVCIGGDLIDGIGIFPNQDKEIRYMKIGEQMACAMDLLAKIPKHIRVFVIPGNHDPGRRALPQPALPKVYSDKLYSSENFTMLGNPSLIELDGVKVLMFHGQSLDDIIATTPGLSYSKPAEAMKVLLKARHLSPIYGQRTPIAPEQEDLMVMTEVPDVFHSGHVHITDVQNYRGTLIVNSGAWQTQTPFQQTMGIMPTPGIMILIDLATLQPYKIDFTQQ